MSILFIAEKPSVAQGFAKALSKTIQKEKGYIKGDNDYIFTWALGHLVEIKPPDKMNEDLKDWRMEDLPIIPEKLLLQPKPGADEARQLSIIKKLSLHADEIYCCTDAGREGNLIFEFLSLYLGFAHKKTIKRVWTSSNQASAIRKAVEIAKPWSTYKAMRDAAIIRSQADYIIGINFTRALTLKTGITANAGRVLTPTLGLIYDRYKEIEDFKKVVYYPVEAVFSQDGEEYIGKLETDRITDVKDAKQQVNVIVQQKGFIEEIVNETNHQSPPSLVDLTELTKEANKRYGFKASHTLSIAQVLYEKLVITYPRTNSKFVTSDEIPLMQKSFELLKNEHLQWSSNAKAALVNENNKNVCDSKKVTDHHAILPEPVIATDLTEKEQKIYDIIVERFFLQFHEKAIIQNTKVITECNGQKFITNHRFVTSLGWKSVCSQPPEENNDTNIMEELPKLYKGAVLCQKAQYKESQTSPPTMYTDGTLMDIMDGISRRLNEPKMKAILKDIGIGTVATRPSIISKLEKVGYIEYQKKKIVITQKGKYLIELLKQSQIKALTSPEYTAVWELKLQAVEQEKASPTVFLKEIEKFTYEIVESIKNLNVERERLYETVGICPECQRPIRISPKRFYCSGLQDDSCTFFIWREQFGKKITENMLTQLLSKGKTSKLTFTSGKSIQYKGNFCLPCPVKNGKLVIETTV